MSKNRELENRQIELLESFFINAHDGIFIVDKNGTLLLANPSIVKLLGTSYKEIEGNSIEDIMERGYYENSPSLKCLETGKTATGLVKTRTGLEIMSTSRPVYNENGELELVITNCRPLNFIISFLKKYKLIDKNSSPALSYGKNSDTENSLIFNSPIMQKLISTVHLVSNTDSSVIIYGQSGTGKSVLAKYIHQHSHRSNQKFVEINCAAIPESLMESELFGYEKGAFTGANAQGKLGLFEIADGGTIFLDEIGEMPLSLQSKLLKILDTGYIIRVGGTVAHKVSTRIIVATNKDLKQLVKSGLFREDLFYRLNVVPLTLPPLNKRPEDITPIANQILITLNKKYQRNKTFSNTTLIFFNNYSWPGNIRQMKNIIERFYITTTTSVIDINHQNMDDLNNTEYASSAPEYTAYYGKSLKEFMDYVELDYITYTINKNHGSVTNAAKELGVHRTLLYKKLNRITNRIDKK